jgi:hypothetical protein
VIPVDLRAVVLLDVRPRAPRLVAAAVLRHAGFDHDDVPERAVGLGAFLAGRRGRRGSRADGFADGRVTDLDLRLGAERDVPLRVDRERDAIEGVALRDDHRVIEGRGDVARLRVQAVFGLRADRRVNLVAFLLE